MKEMYAPIIIPTCNRINHLKKCIDSLCKCKEATETELYISVDFPPNEKYYEGHDEVVEYVKHGIVGFKKVNYYIMKKNIGETNAVYFLLDQIKEKYDTFIFVEDDIVFSAFALSYFNEGLIKYKNNDSISQIASSFFDVSDNKREKLYDMKSKKEVTNFNSNDNVIDVFCTSYSSGWGFATWINKFYDMVDKVNKDFFSKLMLRPDKLIKLASHSYVFFEAVPSTYFRRSPLYTYKNGDPIGMDYQWCIFLVLNNKNTIFPSENLSANHGFDGSGMHCDLRNQDESSLLIPDKEYSYRNDTVHVYRMKDRIGLYRLYCIFRTYCKALLVRVIGEQRYFEKHQKDTRNYETCIAPKDVSDYYLLDNK